MLDFIKDRGKDKTKNIHQIPSVYSLLQFNYNNCVKLA